MKANYVLLLAAGLLLGISCHKANKPAANNTTNPDTAPTSSKVIADFCTTVALPTYSDLYNNAMTFQAAVTSFSASPNNNDLNTMRTAWKGMRAAYELGEAFLIGPISTMNLDPNIDTWPVEKTGLDSLITADSVFTPAFIAGLPQTLIGFHPIEYLIFGTTGTVTASSFTPRKTNYLVGLTNNLVANITLIKSSYVVGSSNDYASVMNSAGPSNTTYSSRKAVLLDLVDAMSGICGEVGGNASDGKIYSVYSTQDATLQESYFSNNSWTDFKNNITGVKNVYTASYGSSMSNNSLSNFVASKNLSLNNTVLQSLNTAINAFNTVSLPFGQSVQTTGGERTQVLNIMTAIDSLQSTLDNKLRPFINQYVTD